MATSLLTCPICSQPGFSTVDSLRIGLISAATRQLMCPVCQDILLGLDKFTIHLFSHSVQHNYTNQSPPVNQDGEATETGIVQQQSTSTSSCGQQVSEVSHHLNEEKSEVKEVAKRIINENLSKESACITQVSQSMATSSKEHSDSMSEFLQSNRHFFPNNQITEAVSYLPTHTQVYNAQQQTPVSEYTNEKNEEGKNMKNKKEHGSSNLQYDSTKDKERVDLTSEIHNPSTIQNTLPLDHSSIDNDGKDCPLNLCNSSGSCAASTTDDVTTEENMCKFCRFSFPDSSILQLHRQLVHRNCDGSESPAASKDSSKRPDERRQFPCPVCLKAFKMRGSLMVHLRVVHGGIGAGKIVRSPVECEQQTDVRSFACNACGKSFKKEQHLSQHVKTHEGKQWECDVCSKLFTTKYFLKKHKRLHTGEMPYSCTTCNKTFTFQQSYHKHLLYHSDDKPHVCSECDRAFKELSTLHNHQRIHTGEKPFACETCGKCFRQRVSYLVHRRIHTGAMPYRCTACGKSFRYKVSQRTHKCPSQPPGMVVRQSGELVQKLLQKAAQEPAAAATERVEGTPNSSDSSAIKPSQSSKPQQSCSTSVQQQQCQRYPNNQFIIFFDSGMQSVGSHNLLLTPSLLVVPQEASTSLSIESNGGGGQENSTGAIKKNSALEKQLKSKNYFEGINSAMSEKFSEATTSFKQFQQNSGDNEKNCGYTKEIRAEDLSESGGTKTNVCSSRIYLSNNSSQKVAYDSYIENNFTATSNAQQREHDINHISNLERENVSGGKEYNGLHKVSNLWTDKKQKVSSKEFTNTCCAEDNTVAPPDGSDLIVETTDFFTMVMSPSSVKSLPSPSEGLRHLTLSPSHDSCSLKHQEEGLYQFFVDEQHNPTLLPVNKPVHNETSDFSISENHCSKRGLSTCSGEGNESFALSTFSKRERSLNCENSNKFSANSEPLQTINEESLKQLLYGTSP